MTEAALVGLLLTFSLCGLARADDDPCVVTAAKVDLCAIASEVASKAQAKLPAYFEMKDPWKGVTATSIVADNNRILISYVSQLSWSELLKGMDDKDLTLPVFQRQFEAAITARFCKDGPRAAFVRYGGKGRAVFLSADGKIFALAEIDTCETSGS